MTLKPLLLDPLCSKCRKRVQVSLIDVAVAMDISPYRNCQAACSCGRRYLIAVAPPSFDAKAGLPQWTCPRCGCIHLLPSKGVVVSVKETAR